MRHDPSHPPKTPPTFLRHLSALRQLLESEMSKADDISDGAYIGILVAIYPFSALWYSWVLTKLWAWFLVPLGMVPVGILGAYGASLVVVYMTKSPKKDEDATNSEKLGWAIGVAVLKPSVFLVVGWLTYAIMATT